MASPAPEAPSLKILQQSTLLPFLPMIYVAWADGDLSALEIEEICRRMHTEADLDPDCRTLLGGWMDPDVPPPPAALKQLLKTIRNAAREQNLDPRQRLSLTELGLAVAKVDRGVSSAERAALERVEDALGLLSAEVTREILVDERPKPPAEPERPEPAFDLGAMGRLLDGERRELRQRVRALVSEPEFAFEYGLSTEEQRAKTLRLCRRLAEEGFGSLSFPRFAGGQRDDLGFLAVFETLACHDLSLLVKYGVQFGLFGGSIFQLGTEKHHRKYLGQVGTLELPGCFAMTETGHGSNVREVETTATYDAETGELVIHTPHVGARKDYIGNAARDGRMATVFAQLEVAGESYGVHAILVPIRDAEGQALPGVTLEDCGHKLGLNGVDNGRLGFDRVRVPKDNLLDRFASLADDGTYTSPIPSEGKRFFTMLGTLVGGRIAVAFASNSAAKVGLAIAVRYGERRRQFGPSGGAEVRLMDYLTHQRRLLPRLAEVYALDFALKGLAKFYAEASSDQGASTDRREVEALAAGLKALSSWNCIATLQNCRECCGGKGYLSVNRFADLKADTDVFATFEGDNTVLLQLVARGLLGDYKRQFSDMNVFGFARYFAKEAATTLAAHNPIATRRTDPEHLRDRDFHLAAFRWRKHHLLGSVARRMKKRLDAGMDSFEALIEVQDHVIALARAHVEEVILDAFQAAIEAADPGPATEGLGAILSRLCDLYALERLEADSGWFLQHGYFEDAKARAIQEQVTALCRELRPQAEHMVNAFGIPDASLAAPIAF